MGFGALVDPQRFCGPQQAHLPHRWVTQEGMYAACAGKSAEEGVDPCPACRHPRDEHVGRWCRVATGAVNAPGRKLICCCEMVEADPSTTVRIETAAQADA